MEGNGVASRLSVGLECLHLVERPHQLEVKRVALLFGGYENGVGMYEQRIAVHNVGEQGAVGHKRLFWLLVEIAVVSAGNHIV